jgi:hypothetical protein
MNIEECEFQGTASASEKENYININGKYIRKRTQFERDIEI